MHLKEQGGGKFPGFRSLAHCFCTVVVQTDPILPPTQLPFPWYLIQIQALNSQAGKARQYNKESLLFPSSHSCQSQPRLYLQRAALSSVSILALCASTGISFLAPFYISHLLSTPSWFSFLWSNSLQGEIPYPHTNPAPQGSSLKLPLKNLLSPSNTHLVNWD